MLVAASANAASIVDYRILIDGAVPASPLTLAAGSTHTLTIEGRVSGNDVVPGAAGGFIQASFNANDSANAVTWTEGVGFLGNPNGNWASSANPAFVNHNSAVLADGKSDAIAETGSIPPSNWDTQFNAVGAGVFNMVAQGGFKFGGATTTLFVTSTNAVNSIATLVGSAIGGRPPDQTNGASVVLQSIVPEPATVALGAFGLVGLATLRRRK